MKKKLIVVLIIIVFGIIGTAYASTGFLIGQKRSGLYTICYYNCLGSTVAITIKSTKLCPLTIECDQVEMELEELEMALIYGLKEYIKVLVDEINSLTAFAYTHGWKSKNYEKGKKLRDQIDALDRQIAEQRQ